MKKQEKIKCSVTLIRAFTEHIIPIFAAGTAAAVIGFLLAFFAIPKIYASEAVIYIGDTGDIESAGGITETCRAVILSDYVLDGLSGKLGIGYTRDRLSRMIKTEVLSSPRELSISVEAGSAQESYEAADELTRLSVSAICRLFGEGSAKIVRAPTYPETHSFPDTVLFTVTAAITGIIVTYIVFLVREVSDKRLRAGDDLPLRYGLPELARIPDLGEDAEEHGST
ncbi:MAG: hypothetical protein J6X60_03885 [Ruminiclostridium sp.]|nr:hypothetical protein [Ruminiclostridium sp.]